MQITIGILEDDPLTRNAIAESLESRGFKVVVKASSAVDFLACFKRTPMDVALLDLHLGEGPTGVDVASQIRSANRILGIVFLTSFSDPRLLSPSLKELPKGSRYVTKGSIDDISLLEAEIHASLADVEGDANRSHSDLDQLTDGQIETLRLVAAGYTNSQIAKERYVTEKTVEATLSRIAKVLNLNLPEGHNARIHMAQVYFRARGMEVYDGTFNQDSLGH